jgi:hypothetical protein
VASISNNSPSKVIRCAIYTRKSTEEGLEQNFNSLDAQRDAGEAYIRSQTGEGWTVLPTLYDDGGFTGANMERPAMRRLLADSQAGKVDCVVVYKVDRLSRNIRDFAKIMEVFDNIRNVRFLASCPFDLELLRDVVRVPLWMIPIDVAKRETLDIALNRLLERLSEAEQIVDLFVGPNQAVVDDIFQRLDRRNDIPFTEREVVATITNMVKSAELFLQNSIKNYPRETATTQFH